MHKEYKILQKDQTARILHRFEKGKAIVLVLYKEKDKYYLLSECEEEQDSYLVIDKEKIKEISKEEFERMLISKF